MGGRSKLGMVAVFFVVLGWLAFSGGDSAEAQGKKKKLIKFDPEIQAALNALNTAKAKLGRAITDEVVGEKGNRIEQRVVRQLEIAIEHVNKALAATRKARALDKNP
jgi:hypothetical protein